MGYFNGLASAGSGLISLSSGFNFLNVGINICAFSVFFPILVLELFAPKSFLKRFYIFLCI